MANLELKVKPVTVDSLAMLTPAEVILFLPDLTGGFWECSYSSHPGGSLAATLISAFVEPLNNNGSANRD